MFFFFCFFLTRGVRQWLSRFIATRNGFKTFGKGSVWVMMRCDVKNDRQYDFFHCIKFDSELFHSDLIHERNKWTKTCIDGLGHDVSLVSTISCAHLVCPRYWLDNKLLIVQIKINKHLNFGIMDHYLKII